MSNTQEIKIKSFSKQLSLLTAVITLIIGIYSVSQYSAANFAVIIWNISPYAFLAALINLTANKIAVFSVLILTLITCGFGLIYIVDVVFIHVKSHGELANSIAPLWQWAGLIILTLPLVLLNKLQK